MNRILSETQRLRHRVGLFNSALYQRRLDFKLFQSQTEISANMISKTP